MVQHVCVCVALTNQAAVLLAPLAVGLAEEVLAGVVDEGHQVPVPHSVAVAVLGGPRRGRKQRTGWVSENAWRLR